MPEINNAGKEDKIQWFGIDGALCLLYILEAVFIGYSLINNDDFVIGKLVPYGTAAVTILIFLKYIVQVISFSPVAKKK